MKNPQYDNKLSMVLDIAKKSGMTLMSLSRELGVTRATVSRWHTGIHMPEDPDEVLSKVRLRAKFLSKIDLDAYDIRDLKNDFGITYSAIAEDLGITCEGLTQLIEDPDKWNSSVRKSQTQEYLRSIGRNLLRSSN